MSLGPLLAYPLLLFAGYGLARIGRGRLGQWEWARFALLALLLVLLAPIHFAFVSSGALSKPWGIVAASFGLASLTGLAGMQLLTLLPSRRGGVRAEQGRRG